MKQGSKFILIFVILLFRCSFENVIVKWENGYIPYFYTGYFTEDEKVTVRAAMKEWENACGVRFEEVLPRSSAYEIVKTENSTAWASSIGENNITNRMFFGVGSDIYGHILHELGHCLGLMHEHQRPDRDLYVYIVWDNIWPEYDHNFETRDNPLYKEEEHAYDYNSIMHYHSRGFSIDGGETIVPKDGRAIERSDSLTPMDIEKAQAIYGQPL